MSLLAQFQFNLKLFHPNEVFRLKSVFVFAALLFKQQMVKTNSLMPHNVSNNGNCEVINAFGKCALVFKNFSKND